MKIKKSKNLKEHICYFKTTDGISVIEISDKGQTEIVIIFVFMRTLSPNSNGARSTREANRRNLHPSPSLLPSLYIPDPWIASLPPLALSELRRLELFWAIDRSIEAESRYVDGEGVRVEKQYIYIYSRMPPFLSKYVIGRTLGEGNFGKVKYARHVESGLSFAIKILDLKRIQSLDLHEQVSSISIPAVCFDRAIIHWPPLRAGRRRFDSLNVGTDQ